MQPYTLLALAPAGETFFASDGLRQVWLFLPRGAGDPRVVEPDVVRVAIAEHGFDRAHESFETWADLYAHVLELPRRVPPAPLIGTESYDLPDVERLFAVVERWAHEGRITQSRTAALNLLQVPVAAASKAMRDRLVTFVAGLDEPADAFRSVPISPRHEAGRTRWHDLQADRQVA